MSESALEPAPVINLSRGLIERAKAVPMIAVCRHLLPDGGLDGPRWVARNPVRHDETAGSFSIDVTTGIFKDYASSDCHGNDTVALWKYIRQCGSMLQAAKELLAEMDGRVQPEDRQATKIASIRATEPIMPVPDDAPKQSRDIHHPKLGKPTRGTFRYFDQQRRLLGYVCIWEADPENGLHKKETRPYCFCIMSDGCTRWAWAGPKGEQPRPLYRLDRLGECKTVVLVEGELKAELGATLFPSTTAVLGWMGGSAAAPYVDLNPLAGRTVVLFPDHDAQRFKDGEGGEAGKLKPYSQQPGVMAMHTIGTRLLGLGCKVYMVDYSMGEMPSGWDLADAFAEKWTTEQVQAYIMNHKRDFSKPALAPSSQEEIHDALWASQPVYSQINPMSFPMTDFNNNKLFDMWQNVAHMLMIYGIGVSYDMMRKEAQFDFPDGQHANIVAIDEIYSMCSISKVPSGALDRHLNVITRRSSFHPAVHWIDSLSWDGKDRIDALLETIHSDPGEKHFVRQLVLRWMVSAIALIYRERAGARGAKPSAHGVLTFTGVTGGGKTSWFQSLAPGEMVHTGASLQCGNKDSEVIVLRSWITELGEVGATFRKSDLEALKAFITRSVDIIRMPFGRVYDAMDRQTVFGSSVNDPDFLADKTGNRRWWVIQANNLDYDHDVDMQQLWAQILVMYRGGEQWHLTPDEFAWLNKSNEKHMQPSPVEHTLMCEPNWEETAESRWSWQTPGNLLLRITGKIHSTGDCREAAKWLRENGKHEKSSGKNQLFWVPYPK